MAGERPLHTRDQHITGKGGLGPFSPVWQGFRRILFGLSEKRSSDPDAHTWRFPGEEDDEECPCGVCDIYTRRTP